MNRCTLRILHKRSCLLTEKSFTFFIIDWSSFISFFISEATTYHLFSDAITDLNVLNLVGVKKTRGSPWVPVGPRGWPWVNKTYIRIYPVGTRGSKKVPWVPVGP